MDQKIDLEANTTYVLKADLISHGCIVDLKASGFDGKYSSTSVSYSQNANGELIFTTGKHAKDIKITIQVLRYQNTSDVVSVDNISLTPVNG